MTEIGSENRLFSDAETQRVCNLKPKRALKSKDFRARRFPQNSPDSQRASGR